MIPKLLRAIWGDLSKEELKKFGILSATLMLILGDYWMLRTLKDALFEYLVGFAWQPWAKIVSVIVMGFVVLGYSKLVDIFDKHMLFYIISPVYSLIFLILSYLIFHPDLIAISSNSFFYPLVSWIPGKVLGWVIYVLIESFGSLFVVLFWSIVVSTTEAESAKKGFGMILFFTQIGTILGPFIVSTYVITVGAPTLFAAGGLLVLIFPILMRFYMGMIPKEFIIAKRLKRKQKKQKTGFFAGLKLIFTHSYVAGIFVIATAYEVIGAILEFQMKLIAAKEVYVTRDAFAAFNGSYGMGVNILTLTFTLFGTSVLMRKFGIKFCLYAYPIIVGCVVSFIYIFNGFGLTHFQLMWTLFAGMIAIKGLNYALNNPTKEVIYIPTSKDIKFKSKGWIDMFGNRTMKGVGAGVNAIFASSFASLFFYGNIISLGVVVVWIFVAGFMGKTFDKLQYEGKIVE